MIKTLIACIRLVRLTVHLIHGLLVVIWRFPGFSQQQKSDRIQAWSHALLARIAITVVVDGRPPRHGPMLLVANHISWLDITMMLASGHCRFVAKSEIQHWPLIGRLARATGTLFITRESSRAALHVVHHMAEQLKAGEVLAVFPEGTTSNGLQLLPFHANLFQAAISADAPVQPVALQFVDANTGQPSLAPCYIDDDTLFGSVWRTLTAPPLRATLIFGVPQSCNGRDRRSWARDARESVAALLQQQNAI
jgi:1-acyl-sn-glycerol-3-phosphate acyltransferase